MSFKPHCSRKVTARIASPDLSTTFSYDIIILMVEWLPACIGSYVLL